MTPGLKLIHDLLAKSVAKWSAANTSETERESKRKRTEDREERKKRKKFADVYNLEFDYAPYPPNIKEERKIEYIEPKPMFHDFKLEVKDENDTDEESKIADPIKEVKIDEGENKSLIKIMLEKSVAKYTENQDEFHKLEKNEKKKLNRSVKYENIHVKNGESDDKSDFNNHVKTEGNENVAVQEEVNTKNYTNKIREREIKRKVKLTHVNVDEENIDNPRDDNNTATGRKYLRSHTCNIPKKFTSEEDEILVEAMATFGDTINIGKLAKQLDRPRSSVRDRLIKLRTGKRQREKRAFSLTDDLLIMERVLENLPGNTLRDLSLHNDGTSAEVATALGRNEVSSRNRWGHTLKPWILQHYSGTLNFDIRIILANYLAENFDCLDSIDWVVVATRPEFVGHTQGSLRSIFYGHLFKSTKLNSDIEYSQITLKNIADNANVAYSPENSRKVSQNVLKRQKSVIDYFEQYVKKHDIINFL